MSQLPGGGSIATVEYVEVHKGHGKRLLAALVVTAAVVAFGWPMFAVPGGIASGDRYRDNDWLNCRSFDLMSRQALLEHGQFPLRSHLVGGGFPTIAHPSDGSWAPTLAAVLLLGDVLGVKVNILLMLLLGCWGVFGLSRRWLRLSPMSSLFAALLFGFSGWLPSMMLVGFYHQLFYMAVPGIVLLVLTSAGRADRLLLAGLLLGMVLQQGGNAFPCTVLFLCLAGWLTAAEDAGPSATRWQRLGSPLILLTLLLCSLGLARQLNSVLPLVLGWGGAAAWGLRSKGVRGFLRALGPWALRVGLVVAVASTLGAARLAGLQYLRSHGLRYQHTEVCKDKDTHRQHECFYRGGRDFFQMLSGRAPTQANYRMMAGRRVEPLTYEYAWLGLTLPLLLLALVGLVLQVKRRGLLAAMLVIFTAICFGWEAPLDAHALLVSGIPGLHLLGQPIKYFNFFILLPLVLLAAAGVEGIASKVIPGWGRRAVQAAGFALLLLPFLQNRPILGELFHHPLQRPAPEAFHQVQQIGARSWIDLPAADLRRRVEAGGEGPLRLRETDRPLPATEYYNVQRGVGTIDWYGTLLLPERAMPRRYLLPDGKSVANPRHVGEAWTRSGAGRVLSVTIQPNTIDVEVDAGAGEVVVINQSYLEGFSASSGTVLRVPAPGAGADDRHGLLGVRLPRAGKQAIHLRYGPSGILAGLAASAVALLGWIAAYCWLCWRRRRSVSCK